MATTPSNPYQPPSEASTATERPLYDINQIGVATFLGSPLAGAIVMALNYRRLAPEKVVPTIVMGVIASAAVFGLAFALPEDFPNIVLPAAYLAAVVGIASKTQGAAIKQAVAAGEPKASGWRSAGIGLGISAVMLALFAVVFFAIPEDKVVLGAAQQQEIYFQDGATEHDARRLHGALRESGFLQEQPVTITIARESGGWLVTMVLIEGAWNDASTVMSLRTLAGQLSTTFGGRVRIAMADDHLEVRKTVDPI